MPSEVQPTGLSRLICADTRFSLPDVLNDHCWEVGTCQSQPPSLSAFTTFGLRASRMLVLPSFLLDDLTRQDPAQFFAPPVIRQYSTNFITLAFSPFQGIDVLYTLWVPTSQMLMGELVCSNRTESTRSLQVDWQVRLAPLNSGSPMKHTTIGLSNVLQGECADLFPVFYLSGDSSPSSSSIPGLTTRYLLMPGSSKRSTWSLVSLSSADASFQMARQYSSKSLDMEKLRVEMADKLNQVHISTARQSSSETLQTSRIRTLQLIMPPMANFKSRTFVNSRSTDSGYHPRSDVLEIHPEWSGQTLPQIWLLAQSLLPGNPELVRGFLMNMLSRRPVQGGVDHRVGLNGTLTGHAALPLFAQLVAELHPYLNDLSWLEEVYPDLLASIRTWLVEEPEGILRVRGLTHPIQLGMQITGKSEKAASEIWMRLQCENNLFVTALLIREINDLMQISRWLNKHENHAWLENLKAQLTTGFLSLRDELTGLFRHPASSSDHPVAESVIHTYHRNGFYTPRRKLTAHCRVYLRVTGDTLLPGNFFCVLHARRGEVPVSFHIDSADFSELGYTRVYVVNQFCDFLESVEIRHLPVGMSVEIGQTGFTGADLFQLLTLYAGVLSPGQADQLLRHLRTRDFFSVEGISLLPAQPGEPTLLAPAYLVGLIVDGLLRYEKVHLANQVFQHHFIDRLSRIVNTSGSSRPANLLLDDLLPSRLFLKIHGVVRFTDHEVILSHFIKRKQDALTVQYKKIELHLKPFLTEIHTQSGEVIYLNRAGPNRVLLD